MLRPIALLALIAGACGSVAVAQASVSTAMSPGAQPSASPPGVVPSAPTSPATTPTAPAVLPPALVALEQKMRELQVNSESFTKTVSGTTSIELGVGGRRGKRRTHTLHISKQTIGQASLSPREATVTNVTAGTPSAIEIGSNVYLYLSSLAKRDRGRPWVHFKSSGAGAFELFPFHGESSTELNEGGSGPYAGLLNLLATTTGPVGVVGPETVDGQQATGFTARVEPLKLVKTKGLTRLVKALRAGRTDKLEVSITESGLPVRVSLTSSLRTSEFSSNSTETTDVTSINVPFTVGPPPTGQTIGEARFKKLLGLENEGLLKGVKVNGSHRVRSPRKK